MRHTVTLNSARLLFSAAVLVGCGPESNAKASVATSVASPTARSRCRARPSRPTVKQAGGGERFRAHPAHPGPQRARQRVVSLGDPRGQKGDGNWPTGPAPLAGALLPEKRIVAFYGNPLVKKMGVLGEYPDRRNAREARHRRRRVEEGRSVDAGDSGDAPRHRRRAGCAGPRRHVSRRAMDTH